MTDDTQRGMAALAEMIMGGDTPQEEPRKPSRPLPEAEIMELMQIYQRYQEGCVFSPGAIVTPRANSQYKGHGEPCIVLEVPAEPHRVSFDHNQDNEAGARLDMRIGRLAWNYHQKAWQMSAWWVESWQYQSWVEVQSKTN